MILLTGATGFVGSNLMKELLKQGLQVRCLIRNPDWADALKKTGAELVKGDITDKDNKKKVKPTKRLKPTFCRYEEKTW